MDKIIKYKLLHRGRCKCVYEPRGDYGLEGYQLNLFYDYEMRQSEQHGRYYKVNCNDKLSPGYGQTCTPRAFNKFFEISGQC